MRLITALLVVGVLTFVAPPIHAQDFQRNAWGFYAAPVIYGYSEGTEYQLASNGGGLDLGVYYARFLSSRFSVRGEFRYGRRAMEDWVEHDVDPGSVIPANARISETLLQIPIVLTADRRVTISNHELRVSTGGGVSYTYVLEQKILNEGGEIEIFDAADSYQRFGLLLDGGVAFAVARGDAVFARIRFDIDISTFGEPVDADVIQRFWSTGLYAGYEMGF